MTVKNSPSTTAQSIVATLFVFVSAMINISIVIVEKRRRKLIEKIKEIEDYDSSLSN